MDTDSAALLIALLALAVACMALGGAILLKAGPPGPEGRQGPPGPMGPMGRVGAPGVAPSLDSICDRVVEILDPRAGAEFIRELGSRWPVATINELESPSKGVKLLGDYLERRGSEYTSFLIVAKFDPDRDRATQFGGASAIRDAEIALGVTEDELYVIKDRWENPRVITSTEDI